MELLRRVRLPWQQLRVERDGFSVSEIYKRAAGSVARDTELIMDRYGIRVETGERVEGDLDDVAFESISNPIALAQHLGLMKAILGCYPPDFIRFCNITQARVADTLTLSGDPYLEESHSVGGVADSSGPIYVAALRAARNTHHEILHRADQQSGELTASKLLDWAQINPSGYLGYMGEGYYKVPEAERPHIPHGYGFISSYSRVDIFEDRATIMEVLMTNPKRLQELTSEDKILAEKTRVLMEDLERWSGGRMDNQYFKDLWTGKVNEEYWG